MSPQGLANCFWALSKLTGSLDRDRIHVADVVMTEVENRINELPYFCGGALGGKAQDLASIIWSAAVVTTGQRRSEISAAPLLAMLAAPTMAAAVELSSRQLTNAAWAMAMVSRDFTKTVEVLVEEALSRPPSARDLDNLCWALAAVRGFSGSMLTETIQGVTAVPTLGMLWALCVTETPGAGPLLMAVVQDGSLDTLVNDSQSLVQLLWCQAHARASGSKLLLNTMERVEELKSLDLSRCAWACVVLEVRGGKGEEGYEWLGLEVDCCGRLTQNWE
eukprot:symbB.v1.2.024809.t2/scaffold2371.1/size80895/5